jgi:hypothetical protein
LNPLSRERELPPELAQLVTIGHQNRKIFDCLALRLRNRDCVNFEGPGDLAVTQLCRSSSVSMSPKTKSPKAAVAEKLGRQVALVIGAFPTYIRLDENQPTYLSDVPSG